jgi:hypothetical protein
MQDRPTAPELLDAMAAQLYGEVREWVPRERRFQVLVLANLCAVIARELRAGESPSRADARLFGELGAAAEEPREAAFELARRIRAGELDERLPELIDGLREHVARKLEIARPGYA